jgi:hypothetical protein
MQPLPLRLAAGALVVGGLVLGGAPMPLSPYGCRPALDSTSDVDQSIEVVVACADARADRQTAVGVLWASGAALLGLSVRPRRLAPATPVTSDAVSAREHR